MRRGLWVADGNADKRVGTAIIEEPLALMPDEAFRKDRSGSILTALLEVGNGTEERLVESVNELINNKAVADFFMSLVRLGNQIT
jgi:hypothetical protein